jgi:hypothetical protein
MLALRRRLNGTLSGGMVATAIPVEKSTKLIRPVYFLYVAVALSAMFAAILSHDVWFLNWTHVMAGTLWTGIDLFMGFVLGPVLGQVDGSARKQVLLKLVPRTLFILPTLAVVTGTSGWFLAVDLGFTGLPWPQIAWLYAALVIITILTVQGLGYLLPTELRVCLELQKKAPDYTKIDRMMRGFFLIVALQGAMQIAIIVIMAKFASGI